MHPRPSGKIPAYIAFGGKMRVGRDSYKFVEGDINDEYTQDIIEIFDDLTTLMDDGYVFSAAQVREKLSDVIAKSLTLRSKI